MSDVFTALVVSEELSMKLDCLLDVLIGMREYARANGLPLLAEHLDDAAMVAFCEVATLNQLNDSASFDR